MTHCMVQRNPRCGGPYLHHFILLQINKDQMTVAHYAYAPTHLAIIGASDTAGKFILQTFQFRERNPEKPCGLLDFLRGVYIVRRTADRRDRRDAIFRMVQRLDESKYNLSTNNCEHIVDDILYKTQQINQAGTNICRTNICGWIVNYAKETVIYFFFITLFMMCLVLTEFQNVGIGILVSAIYFHLDTNVNISTDPSSLGVSMTSDAPKYLVEDMEDVLSAVLMKHNRTFDKNIIGNVSIILTHSLVLETADLVTKRFVFNVLSLSILCPATIDLFLTEMYITNGLKPLGRKELDKFIHKERFVRSLAMIFAYPTASYCGYPFLINTSSPTNLFLAVNIVCMIVFRCTYLYLFGKAYDTACLKRIRRVSFVKSVSRCFYLCYTLLIGISCLILFVMTLKSHVLFH